METPRHRLSNGQMLLHRRLQRFPILLAKRTEPFWCDGNVQLFTTIPLIFISWATNHQKWTIIDNFKSTHRQITLRLRWNLKFSPKSLKKLTKLSLTVENSQLDDERSLRSESSSGFVEYFQSNKTANWRIDDAKNCKFQQRQILKKIVSKQQQLFVDWSSAKLWANRSFPTERNSLPNWRLCNYCHYRRELFWFDGARSCCCYVAVSIRYASLKPVKLLGEHKPEIQISRDMITRRKKKKFRGQSTFSVTRNDYSILLQSRCFVNWSHCAERWQWEDFLTLAFERETMQTQAINNVSHPRNNDRSCATGVCW